VVLHSAVGALASPDTYVEVHQLVTGERDVVLAKSTERTAPPTISPTQTPVPYSRWTLFYWSTRLTASGGSGILSSLPLVLTIALAGLLSGIAYGRWRAGRRQPQPDQDTVIYRGAIKSILDGEHPEIEHLLMQGPRPPQANDAVIDESVGNDTIPNLSFTQPIQETAMTTTEAVVQATPVATISDSIFRAYDIRGVVGESLTEDAVYQIGLALGSEAHERGQQEMVVARDGRTSGPTLAAALERGLRESGRDVIDIGMVPTPVLYWATYFLDTHSGVMLTGSHNPSNYNGLKIVLDGRALSGEAITAIRDRIKRGDFTSGSGKLRSAEISADYIERITSDIPVALKRSFKVVVDCGNGVPGILAPKLIRALGHDVIELFCDVDGNFPNHHPDPSQPDNLADLIAAVIGTKSDLGLAFDGDGDRLGVVDGAGNIIWPDRQMMLFARDVLSRNAGAEIIFDVKCSNHLKTVIEQSGGKPLMWKTGHSLIKAKMRESEAPLAGEMSGHIFFKERWYGFDDALYAAARLLEILVRDPRPPGEVFAELPGGLATPELRIDMPEPEHAPFMAKLVAQASFEGGSLATVDGLRVDFADGWGLIRPSNTTPCLVLRFEADNEAALKRIQDAFRSLLAKLGPDLDLPF
jgi:phosphomannomutase/phosphoglucomutase